MTSELLIIRHSDSEYPKDNLSPEGRERAIQNQSNFLGFAMILCSPQIRAIQTANSLGYTKIKTDERLRELELQAVNALSPHEYVMKAHEIEPDAVRLAGLTIQLALSELAKTKERILVVSHNLTMSALLHLLTKEKTSFGNLEGFMLNIDPENNLIFIQKYYL